MTKLTLELQRVPAPATGELLTSTTGGYGKPALPGGDAKPALSGVSKLALPKPAGANLPRIDKRTIPTNEKTDLTLKEPARTSEAEEPFSAADPEKKELDLIQKELTKF
jgi:hypothetical protein